MGKTICNAHAHLAASEKTLSHTSLGTLSILSTGGTLVPFLTITAMLAYTELQLRLCTASLHSITWREKLLHSLVVAKVSS